MRWKASVIHLLFLLLYLAEKRSLNLLPAHLHGWSVNECLEI